MLFLLEYHKLLGRTFERFSERYNGPGGWMERLGETDDARLLWYFELPMTVGESYLVGTLTAVRDGAAWQRLSDRVRSGDLKSWAEGTDVLRHWSSGQMMDPLSWSPLQGIDLESVPTSPQDHGGVRIYLMEHVRPYPGMLNEYITRNGEVYAPTLTTENNRNWWLRYRAIFQNALGSGHRLRELTLMQEIVDNQGLIDYLSNPAPAEQYAPGRWSRIALDIRDEWQSYLLQRVAWSPLP